MRRITTSALVAVAAVGLLAGVAGSQEPPRREVIRIATQGPLSGGLALLGEGVKQSVRLALEKLRGPIEEAGFTVELAPFDDQARAHVGVANAEIIGADPAIVAVIGHLTSAVALPASEVYRAAGLLVISPAETDPLLTDRGLPNVRRVLGRADVQGAVAAEFARETLEAKSAYVAYDTRRHGLPIAESFRAAAERLGMAVLGFEDASEPASLESLLAAIREKNPDVIFFGNGHPRAAALVREAGARGIAAGVLGSGGLDSPERPGLEAPPVPGAHYVAATGPVDLYPGAAEFAAAYRARFGREPPRFAAEAYDAAAVALKALEAALEATGGQRPTRAAVVEATRALQHRGITGDIAFDDHGDLREATYFVHRVESGWPETRLVQRRRLPPNPFAVQ